jgi:5-methylcytosine-specific restriction endonuclease McrA
MFCDEHAPLALLIELTPKLAKKRFRESIYEEWGCKCAYCEEPATSLDHIVPRFKSGSSKRSNLIPACRRCNSGKASEPVESWYKQQDFFNQARMEKIKAWMAQEVVDIFSYHLQALTVIV